MGGARTKLQDTGEGSIYYSRGETTFAEERGHHKSPRMESLNLGADATEKEKLREGDDILARGRVGRGVVQITVGVGGPIVDIS